jgi:uncharacterized protein (UPF0548 family)
MRLEDLAGRSYNYAPVGATRIGETPPGFHRLEVRGRVGTGADAFARAGAALLSWQVQNTGGIRMVASQGTLAEGAESIARLGFGPVAIAAPCRVVWVERTPERVAFAYGTLTGHPEAGEESFTVALDPDGAVWFTVAAYSRPATWYTRLGGPLTRVAQRLAAGRYIARLRSLSEA